MHAAKARIQCLDLFIVRHRLAVEYKRNSYRPRSTTKCSLWPTLVNMDRGVRSGAVRAAVAVLGAGIVAAGTADAHHGFGTFAMNEDIELTGTIASFDFVNPHSWVHFDVTGEDAEIVAWRCELRSATPRRRSGWTPEMFAAGTRITIQGSPDRTDPRACYVSTISFADGSSLDRYGQRIPARPSTERAARRPGAEPNISGDGAQEQLVMTDPRGRDGTLVPLSQAAEFEPGGVPE